MYALANNNHNPRHVKQKKAESYGNKGHLIYYRLPMCWRLLSTAIPFLLGFVAH